MTTAKILNKIKNAKNEFPECVETEAVASFTYKGHTINLNISDIQWDYEGVTFILSSDQEE